MFYREDAEQEVTTFINQDYKVDGDELLIVPEETIEKDYGWVFFYDSKKHLRTGDFSDGLAGNGPVVFDKERGSIHQLGSYAHPDELIREFESTRKKFKP